MTPIECIKHLEKAVVDDRQKHGSGKVMTWDEHTARTLNMLDTIRRDLQNAEYNYVVENTKNKEVLTIEDYLVSFSHLNDEIILVQPAISDANNLILFDMQRLCDILREMKESGKFTKEMIIIPPMINVFKAKLANIVEEENDE